VGNPCPKPQHLAAKLLAIREHLGLSQYQLSLLLEVKHYSRLSEFERGRRTPDLVIVLRYARAAGIPMEFMPTMMLISSRSKMN
jgi:transcriptional regulator with XRE-family HTH domain